MKFTRHFKFYFNQESVFMKIKLSFVRSQTGDLVQEEINFYFLSRI